MGVHGGLVYSEKQSTVIFNTAEKNAVLNIKNTHF